MPQPTYRLAASGGKIEAGAERWHGEPFFFLKSRMPT